MDHQKELAQKELAQIEKSKQKLLTEIAALSKEKAGYAEEMPRLRTAAEEQRKVTQATFLATTEAKRVLSEINQDAKTVRAQVIDQQLKLDQIMASQRDEERRLEPIKEALDQRTADIKTKEMDLNNRNTALETKQTAFDKNSIDIDKQFAELSQKQNDFEDLNKTLQQSNAELNREREKYQATVSTFEGNKIDYFNKQQELLYKLDQVNKLLKGKK